MINGCIVIDDAYIRHDMERLKDNSGASSHDPANIRQLADCRSNKNVQELQLCCKSSYNLRGCPLGMPPRTRVL